MSCHTWVYKKSRLLSDEEQQQVIRSTSIKFERIKPFDEWRNDYAVSILYKDFNDAKLRMMYDAHCINERTIINKLQTLKKISDFSLDEIDHLDWSAIDVKKEGLCGADYNIIGDWYYERIALDEPFRLYGSPDKEFTDIDEMIAWLKDYTKNCPSLITHISNERMCRYIEGMTDELEQLINEFANANGRNDLLFQFG